MLSGTTPVILPAGIGGTVGGTVGGGLPESGRTPETDLRESGPVSETSEPGEPVHPDSADEQAFLMAGREFPGPVGEAAVADLLQRAADVRIDLEADVAVVAASPQPGMVQHDH